MESVVVKGGESSVVAVELFRVDDTTALSVALGFAAIDSVLFVAVASRTVVEDLSLGGSIADGSIVVDGVVVPLVVLL